MIFQNPTALWALTLIAIPIIIHLFNFRRHKKVYFSNLAFLKNIQQQQKNSSTLKKLLVLTARILAIIFLVFAFAQPIIPEDDTQLESGSLAVYVDNSMSMQQSDASGDPILYQVNTAARNLIRRKQNINQLILANNDQVKLIYQLDEIDHKLNTPTFSNNSIPLRETVEKLKARNTRQIHIFSDFQKSTSLPFDEILSDSTTDIQLYKIEPRDAQNIYIDTVFLDKPLALSTENKINFQLRNTGNEEAKDVLIKLEKDGYQITSLTGNIPAKSYEQFSVDVGINQPIDGNYTISIQDNPITFDNYFHFHIPDSKKPKVALLTNKQRSSFELVFAKSDLFDFVKNTASNISFQDIIEADLLILEELEEIPEWLISQKEQLKGTAFIVPNENSDLESYNQFLGTSIQAVDHTSLPLSNASLKNPFFEGIFSKPDDRVDLPEAQIKFELKGSSSSILKDQADRHFLSRIHESNLYFLNSPLTEEFTNLNRHALFVPLMYRLAQPLSQPPLSNRLDQSIITIQNTISGEIDIIKLKSTSEEFVPEFRIIKDNILITLPEVLNKPGFYQVLSGTDTLTTVALNYNKNESETEQLDTQTIQKLIAGAPNITLVELDAESSLLAQNTSDDNVAGLWKYALILALIFLLTESLLLRFLQ